ncbi:MAG: sulfatase-like hydrolase/transferase [Deltaproteobacteria bacterium]|nr:sulfatase-like hydrolase/transferase [Deltaproteobacteria bacterium]
MTQVSLPAIRWLQLAGLASFAITQPLLDLLGEEPGFFVARQSDPSEILLLLILLTLALPTSLWCVGWLAGRFSGRAEGIVHGLFCAALVGLTALPLLKRTGSLPSPALFAAALAIGGAAALAERRVAALRSFFALLAAAPLVFVALFLTRPDVARLSLAVGEPEVSAPVIESPHPVILLIFDELPLTSLLDERGGIDGARYPAFARLAREGTWFRNATSVDWETHQAIPALLTGRYPGPKRSLPVEFEHPHNLFRFLEASHAMQVSETQTRLYARTNAPRLPLWLRVRALLSDLGLVYLHVILPPETAAELPSVTATWKDFGGIGRVERANAHLFVDRPRQFRAFVEAIEVAERPGFHFLHILLPHSVWQYLPSGNSFSPVRSSLAFGYVFPADDWLGMEAYQRHLLQLGFVDRLLGELLARLDELGLYDESILVVTADHGASFWPRGHLRRLEDALHPEDILSVPLFVKGPGQRRAERSLRNAEIIDVFPTIADLLDTPIPWTLDGCSLFDPDCPVRREKSAFIERPPGSKRNHRLVFDAGLGLGEESLQRKLAFFGSGASPGSLFRFGPYRALVGRSVADLAVSRSPVGGVTLDGRDRRLSTSARDVLVPARVRGILDLGDGARGAARQGGARLFVAVAVDGVIRTVVPAPKEGQKGLRVSAMLPEASLDATRAAREQISLYLVTGPADAARLAPLVLR